jgi:hypothetical protein
MVAQNLTAETTRQFIEANTSSKSRLMTDAARQFPQIGKGFVAHEVVNHSKKEYARGDATTNTVKVFSACLSGVLSARTST